MGKENEQVEHIMTIREQRISVLTKIKDFYLNEWVREGYSQDSQRAICASIDIISTLEDKDPYLDKEINLTSGREIHLAIVEKSAAGRTLFFQI